MQKIMNFRDMHSLKISKLFDMTMMIGLFYSREKTAADENVSHDGIRLVKHEKVMPSWYTLSFKVSHIGAFSYCFSSA